MKRSSIFTVVLAITSSFGALNATELIDAVRAKNASRVKKLITEGADVREKDKNGDTALIVAAQQSDPSIALLLLDSEAFKVDEETPEKEIYSQAAEIRSAMHIAKSNKNKFLWNLLYVYSWIRREGMRGGPTPLMGATILGLKDVVRFLIDSGHDVNARDFVAGDTVLRYALAMHDHEPEILHMLLAADADPNIPNNSYSFPLEYAAMYGTPDDIRSLLAAGADVNRGTVRIRVKGKDMIPVPLTTPLMQAAQRGDANIVHALLDAGADVSIQNSENGSTALSLALHERHFRVAGILMAARLKKLFGY